MRILCTGGAGYVGSACVRHLLSAGHDVYAYDDLSEGHAEAVPSDRLVVGNIQDGSLIRSILSDLKIEAVMHFAALLEVSDSITHPREYYETNVVGTKTLLDACVDCSVDRFLFSSTAATYAHENAMPLTEESAIGPQVPYGSTKLAAERMIQDYTQAYGIGHVILRYFNAAGAEQGGSHGEDRTKETHLIPLILHAAVGRRDKVYLFGDDWDTRDGTCVRDYVHISDLAEAHRLGVEALAPGDARLYNVGTGTGATVLETLRACEAAAGKPIPHDVAARRAGDPPVLIACADRIKQELGWHPAHDLESICTSAWKWHNAHPDGYASIAAATDSPV